MRFFLRRILFGSTALALLATPVLAQTATAVEKPAADVQESVFPPWQHGANNDAIDRGLGFTVPEVDDLADLHGDLDAPKLALYVGGNYFFAMAPLVKAFEVEHPEYKGHVYWETLPPGLLATHHRRKYDVDCEAGRILGRPEEGEWVDRAGRAGRTRRALRDQ